MAWLLLLAAGVVEIAMAVALKASHGWTKPAPSVLGVGFALLSIFLLTHALKALPSGTAYAVWTGVGAVGVAVFGMAMYGESTSPYRLLCLVMVIGGVIGLRFLEP